MGAIDPGAASRVAFASQGIGSRTLNLTEDTLLTASLQGDGSPLLLSATITAEGSYSAREGFARLYVDGVQVLERKLTNAGDGTAGNPWIVTAATLQHTVAASAAGTTTVELRAVGSDATYGVTFRHGDLYVELKRR